MRLPNMIGVKMAARWSTHCGRCGAFFAGWSVCTNKCTACTLKNELRCLLDENNKSQQFIATARLKPVVR